MDNIVNVSTHTMIKAVLHKRTAKDSSGIVFLQLYVDGIRLKISTGVKVNAVDFDSANEIVKKSHPNSYDFNLIINKDKAKINNILVRHRLSGDSLTPTIIKKEFQSNVVTGFFVPWMIAQIEERIHLESTKKAQKAIAHKLENFQRKILFEDISEDLMQSFDRFMIKQENNAGTRHNAFKTLNTYFKIALKRNLIKVNPCIEFRIKPNKPSPTYLNYEEREKLIQIYENEVLNASDTNILRGFLFSCFTGLRFSDLISISRANIRENIIVFKPVKTQNTNDQTVKVPLTQYALKLISDCPIKKKYLFNYFVEQTVNERLKVIASEANIRKNVTTHVARHTFGTLFWEKTKDLATLQKLMGHSKIEQTMIYTHVSEQMLFDQMAVFEK